MDILNDELLEKVAKESSLELALLKTLKEVETGKSSGFIKEGVPVILFEGHIFYKLLKAKKGLAYVNSLCSKYPTLVYPKWTSRYYLGGIKEHNRLDTAVKIDRDCALQSASYGLFQVMGMNYKLCGYTNLQDFINDMWKSHEEQIKITIKFLSNATYSGKTLLYWLKNHNWNNFAAGYNGPEYKTNKYHTKLATAYEKYSKKG